MLNCHHFKLSIGTQLPIVCLQKQNTITFGSISVTLWGDDSEDTKTYLTTTNFRLLWKLESWGPNGIEFSQALPDECTKVASTDCMGAPMLTCNEDNTQVCFFV